MYHLWIIYETHLMYNSTTCTHIYIINELPLHNLYVFIHFVDIICSNRSTRDFRHYHLDPWVSVNNIYILNNCFVLLKLLSSFMVLRLVYIYAMVMICCGSDSRGMAPAPGIMNTGTSDPTRRYHPASNLEPHDFRVHTRLVR